MNIELNKQQYKTLLTIMYCGEWVLNSHKVEHDKIYRDSEELEQVIFSFAKEAGLEKWIEYDEDTKTYMPTSKMEEEVHIHLEMYDLGQEE